MKIAIVRTTLHRGSGQVVHIGELSRALVARGHEVTVFTGKAEERPSGVEIREIPARHARDFLPHLGGFDIVHTQYHPCLYVGVLARRQGLPHVFTFHGFAPIRHWNSNRQRLKMIRRRMGTFFALRLGANAYIAVSHFLAWTLSSRYLVPGGKIEVIPNGVDLVRFSPEVDGTPVRERYGLADKRVVLYLGRLTRYKGAHFLLSAAPKVLAQIPDAHFVVAGAPRHDALDLPAEASALGIEQHITFTGFVPDWEVPLFYRAADVFCYPSLWEGFGLTPAEAQASGVPVVAFRTTAVPEVVRDGQTGLLVRPGDVEGLAEALIKLLSDEEKRAAMGKRARAHVEEEFRWELVAKRTENVYHKVLWAGR
jgi:1,4-alpha-glucan branching enzyme